MGVKKCEIIYNSPQFDIDFKAGHMIFDRTQSRKFLHFDFDFDMKKDSHKISVSADDMNRFYMENGKAYIVNKHSNNSLVAIMCHEGVFFHYLQKHLIIVMIDNCIFEKQHVILR